MSLRFAVFDIDGTLIDSAESIVAGVQACWTACGFADPDPAAVRRTIGLPWEHGVRALLPNCGDAEFALIRGYYEDVARGARTRPPLSEVLFPGALEALEEIAGSGALLGIVTSRNSRRLTQLLETHGLHDHFVCVKTVDHGPGKPDPHLLLQAMADVGAERNRTVMIGDTVYDIQMAANAGTSGVGVAWGVHEADELRSAGARHVVQSFGELPGIVQELIGGTS
jgi:phosphoglycolate phosphatase